MYGVELHGDGDDWPSMTVYFPPKFEDIVEVFAPVVIFELLWQGLRVVKSSNSIG